ncbi:hypothetical protein [Streptomyces sp. IBSBF 2435]|uniref:hypothetical protein n=1 Tax=Streptomyces sp. IBSBF 2435 TaxID=2903531 RepID=UPI002FDC144A
MSEPIDQIPRQELVESLAAIRTALDVPYAERAEDAAQADGLLRTRVAYVRSGIRELAAGNPRFQPPLYANVVRDAVTYYPVTYIPCGALAEQRHQFLDPAVPPLAVHGPALPVPALALAQASAGAAVGE